MCLLCLCFLCMDECLAVCSDFVQCNEILQVALAVLQLGR